ncbi:hypothetical protein A6R68_17919, partial [Neotoma lepida]
MSIISPWDPAAQPRSPLTPHPNCSDSGPWHCNGSGSLWPDWAGWWPFGAVCYPSGVYGKCTRFTVSSMQYKDYGYWVTSAQGPQVSQVLMIICIMECVRCGLCLRFSATKAA